MRKAVVLNGARKGESLLDPVHRILMEELSGVGLVVQSLSLRDIDIPYCLGCFDCWVRTPGVCIEKGAARDIPRAVVQSDLTVYLTSITFGGYSSELKKAVDHIICLVSPFFARVKGEIHHKPRYQRYPRLMAVGVLERPDEESERIFTTLVDRNALNFHAPAHAAGVIHGDVGAEKIRETVRNLITKVGV